MNHLKNVLAGLSSTLRAFGTAPEYRVPHRGDRRRDAKNLQTDMRTTGIRLTVNANKALENKVYGKVHYRKGA